MSTNWLWHLSYGDFGKVSYKRYYMTGNRENSEFSFFSLTFP